MTKCLCKKQKQMFPPFDTIMILISPGMPTTSPSAAQLLELIILHYPLI